MYVSLSKKGRLMKMIKINCVNCGKSSTINIFRTIIRKCSHCGDMEGVKNPLHIPMSGKGNKFKVETKKTTLNFPVDLLEKIDEKLLLLNKDSRIKIKRGAFIRVLLENAI